MYFRLHVGKVLLPFTSGRSVVECVGIRINVDQLELLPYHAFYKIFKMLVGIVSCT